MLPFHRQNRRAMHLPTPANEDSLLQSPGDLALQAEIAGAAAFARGEPCTPPYQTADIADIIEGWRRGWLTAQHLAALGVDLDAVARA